MSSSIDTPKGKFDVVSEQYVKSAFSKRDIFLYRNECSMIVLTIVMVLVILKAIHVFFFEKVKTRNYLKEMIHFILTFYYLAYTTILWVLYGVFAHDTDFYHFKKWLNVMAFIDLFTNLIFICLFLLLFLFWIGIYSDVFQIRKGKIFTNNTRVIFIVLFGIYSLLWLLNIVGVSGCYSSQTRSKIEYVFYYSEIVIFTPVIIALLVYSVLIMVHYRFLINRPNQRLRLFLSGVIYCTLCLFFFYSHAPFPVETPIADFVNFNYGTEYIFHIICLYIAYVVYYDWECYVIRLKNRIFGTNDKTHTSGVSNETHLSGTNTNLEVTSGTSMINPDQPNVTPGNGFGDV